MTTGQDGIYPPGLNVGRVVDVKSGTATQAHQILIQPGAQLDRLEEVAVLLYHPPPRSVPEQTPQNAERPGDETIADCRLPIANWLVSTAITSHRSIDSSVQSAIGNRQLAMSLCRSLRLP